MEFLIGRIECLRRKSSYWNIKIQMKINKNKNSKKFEISDETVRPSKFNNVWVHIAQVELQILQTKQEELKYNWNQNQQRRASKTSKTIKCRVFFSTSTLIITFQFTSITSSWNEFYSTLLITIMNFMDFNLFSATNGADLSSIPFLILYRTKYSTQTTYEKRICRGIERSRIVKNEKSSQELTKR